MDEVQHNTQVMIASGLVALIGLWEVAEAFAFGSLGDHSMIAEDIIVGALIFAFGSVRFFGGAYTTWISWLNVGLGLWLIAAPFVLGAHKADVWNDIIVGAVVAALSAWSLLATQREVQQHGA